MKLITRFELASKTVSELHTLHTATLKALARTERGTQERRNALASLNKLDAEIGSRPTP